VADGFEDGAVAAMVVELDLQRAVFEEFGRSEPRTSCMSSSPSQWKETS
jgi:hypothetical protein